MCFVFIEPFNSSSRYSITVYLFPCFFAQVFFFAKDFNVMCSFFIAWFCRAPFFRAQFSELGFQSSVFRARFPDVMCLLFRWLWTKEPRMMFRFMFALTNGVRSTKEISFKWKSYQRYMNTCMRNRSISAWVLMDFFLALNNFSPLFVSYFKFEQFKMIRKRRMRIISIWYN